MIKLCFVIKLNVCYQSTSHQFQIQNMGKLLLYNSSTNQSKQLLKNSFCSLFLSPQHSPWDDLIPLNPARMTTATVFLLLDCISRCLNMSTDCQSLRQSQSSIRQSLQEVCTVLSRHCLTFLPLLSTNFFSSLKDTLNIPCTTWNALITWLLSEVMLATLQTSPINSRNGQHSNGRA